MQRIAREPVGFWLLAALHVLPYWLLRFVPTQDGPIHLYNANILATWFEPEGALYRSLYQLNPTSSPAWFGDLILATLVAALPPELVDKLVVTAHGIALAAAARWALAQVEPTARPLAVLVLPLVHGWALTYGFTFFSLSVPAFLLGLGTWYRHRAAWTRARIAAMGAIATLTYLLHPVSFVALAIAALGLAAWLAAGERGRGGLAPALRARIVPTLLALAPGAILLAVFLHEKAGAPVPSDVSFGFRLVSLATLGLELFDPVELPLALAASATFVVAAIAARGRRSARRWSAPDVFGFLGVAFALLVFVAPGGVAGGAFIPPRLVTFVQLAFMLWFASHLRSGRLRQLLLGWWIVVTGVLLAVHVWYFARYAAALSGYARIAENIPAGRTLAGSGRFGLPSALPGMHDRRPNPLQHAVAITARRSRALLLANYQARSELFALRFAGGQAPGRLADYVLVWDPVDERPAERGDLASLEQHYTLVEVRDDLRLYRLRAP